MININVLVLRVMPLIYKTIIFANLTSNMLVLVLQKIKGSKVSITLLIYT